MKRISLRTHFTPPFYGALLIVDNQGEFAAFYILVLRLALDWFSAPQSVAVTCAHCDAFQEVEAG
eukprot:scaffold168166_cov30-Tisochrysis_lutea.AAC.1